MVNMLDDAIVGQTHLWLNGYVLSVLINSAPSAWREVLSAVSQNSVLSPVPHFYQLLI